MLSKEAFDQAYQNGVAAALNEWGLTKTALVGELGSKAGGWLSANPAIQRALIGGGIGTAVGGMTDVGAGRGMVAGAAAGLGTSLGSSIGKQVAGRMAIPLGGETLQAAKRLRPAAIRSQRKQLIRSLGQPQAQPTSDIVNQFRGTEKALARGGLVGGGLGALGLGATTLGATQPPPPPKPWYAGLMGG